MYDATFVGRVGLLATALGIGTAALTGVGVAAADSSAPGPDSSSPTRPARSAPHVERGPSRQLARAAAAAPTLSAANAPASPAAAPAARRTASPAAARRDRSEAARTSAPVAASTVAAPSASLSASPFGNPITINPTLAWDQGVLMGNVGATCSSCGSPLQYRVISRPSAGGKINLNIGPDATQTSTGQFAYLPNASVLASPGSAERFSITVNSTTTLSRFLTGIPLLGSVFSQVFQLLYRTPLVGNLLAPIIGYSVTAGFNPQANTLAEGRPTAFTYRMPSFDGTPISLNYFPALNVANGDVVSAPTVFNGPYLGNPGNTNPNSVYAEGGHLSGLSVPGVQLLRSDSTAAVGGSYSGGGGYNVLSWDPRGEFASGGVLQWDKPFIEGQDVSTMISWLTTAGNPAKDQIATEKGNAVIGMVGGSYGGGIQLNTAGTDPRIKAIVPGITWNSLLDSFYPSGSYLTSYGVGLLGSLLLTGARISNVVYTSTLLGTLTGYLTKAQQAFYASSGPTTLVNNIKAPALLIQGTVDVLFPLQQAVNSAQGIADNGTPAKMIWFCGGHGECIDPENPAQGPNNVTDALKWLDTYVAQTDTPADDIPSFQWYDQRGDYYSSNLLPSAPGFNSGTASASGAGGLLPIVPILGGSGPAPGVPFPYNINVGSYARNAINVKVNVADGQQVAGSPTVSFTYSGLGNARFLYGQFVDNATGRVLGNMTTPVPVTLDGRQHTVTMPLANIAYTAPGPGSALTLQLTSAAVQYASLTSFGLVKVSDVSVALPIINPTNVNP